MISTRHRVAPTIDANNYEYRTRYSVSSENRAVVVGKLQTTGLTTWETIEEWLQKNATMENVRQTGQWIMEEVHVSCNITGEDIGFWVTIYSLFADDLRIVAFQKDADETFETLTAIAFGWFVFEILLASISKTFISWIDKKLSIEGYLFGFYFWLDVLAALSMLLYIPSVAEDMGLDDTEDFGSGSDRSFLIRTGRVIRMARLIRYARSMAARREKAHREQEVRKLVELVGDGTVDGEEFVERAKKLKPRKRSRLGAQLSEGITRKVIVLVLLMFCIVPQLLYTQTNTVEEVAAKSIHKNSSPGDELQFDVAYNEVIDQFDTFSSGDERLLFVRVDPTYGVLLDKQSDRRRLRTKEREVYTFSTTRADDVTYRTKLVFSTRPAARHGAVLAFCLTIAVSVLLLGSANSFTREAQRLVLNPIERMMAVVEQVAHNPLMEVQAHTAKGNHSEFETNLLEATIAKITGLLRVGFGEAGAGIISQNLSLKEGGEAIINPLVVGKRVYAILAFTDIHEFDFVTEVLEKDVMKFVNAIADIVHKAAETWAGQSNKNLGNAFLMVWRIGDAEEISSVTDKASIARKRSASAGSFLEMREVNRVSKQTPSNKRPPQLRRSASVDLKRVPGVDVLADKALIAFLKICVELNRNRSLNTLKSDPRLCHAPGQPFKIRMGVGVHVGWAIEGAVGSMQKVDATYLSPHVNMAARMESACRQYGVSMLLTDEFVQLMSPEGQRVCRKLDVVTVKGSEMPMSIYTYDCNQDQKFNARLKKQVNNLEAAAHYTPHLWHTDPELTILRQHASPAFVHVFNQGIQYYISGEWASARESLEHASEIMDKTTGKGGDGPCQTILRFMRSSGFKCPENWRGYRSLTSK